MKNAETNTDSVMENTWRERYPLLVFA